MAGGGGGWKKLMGDQGRLVIGMVLVQVIATGLQLLSRMILSQGSFVFAYLFYRHIVAALCVAPFAFFLERDAGGLRLSSWPIFFGLFAVALTGITMAMGLFYYGLRDTTATYATNFLNLIPIATFFFSTVFGLEKLGLHTRYGKIKTMGAVLCLGGAVLIAVYKGKEIHLTQIHHLSRLEKHRPAVIITAKHRWLRGTVFLVSSCLSYGLWFILQVKLFGIYPYKYRITFYSSLIASLQQLFIGVCIDRSKSAWQLQWNLQLITIFYSGALATAASFCLISFAVGKRGPTYPSMFNPLSLIFVAIAEALILDVPISLGSLIGMVFIFVGIYCFLWAKDKEFKAVIVAAAVVAVMKAEKTSVQSPPPVADAPELTPRPNSPKNQPGEEMKTLNMQNV